MLQPQLRSFLFKGLGCSRGDLENGCAGAFRALSPLLLCSNSDSRDAVSHRVWSADDDELIRGAVDEALYQHLLIEVGARQAAGAFVTSELRATTLSAVHLILGAQREGFAAKDYEARALIGDHLHVCGAVSDFAVGTDALEPRYHLRMSEAQRQIAGAHGLTAQLHVAFETDATLTETPLDGGASVLQQPQRVTTEWVFESAFDSRLTNDPDWKVVDIDGVLGGNRFWNDIEEV
jgi:hypothetical protein